MFALKLVLDVVQTTGALFQLNSVYAVQNLFPLSPIFKLLQVI